MKLSRTAFVSIIVGAVLGAGTVQGLHAAATPPGYVVAEIEVTNPDAYMKEYAPLAKKLLTEGGGTFLARGGKTEVLDGEPPRPRVAIIQFESMAKALETENSPAYKEARKIGDKYGKFRAFVVEGVTP
jgi:uncharacterized protein (DUF1330 family)